MIFSEESLPANVIAYAKDYSHGTVEATHSHSCAQFLHTLTGVIRIDTALGSWVIPPNKGMWLPAGVEHGLTIIGEVKVRTLFVDPLARADLPNRCLLADVQPLLQHLIVEAVSVPDERAKDSRDERIIELILDELRRLRSVDFYLPKVQSEDLSRLCDHLSQHIDRPWSSTDAARFLGVSERTISRKFQQETKLTFIEWLRQKRLLLALEHLASGHSVLDTALAIGYDSPSAFSAVFKSRLGLSPSEYFSHSDSD